MTTNRVVVVLLSLAVLLQGANLYQQHFGNRLNVARREIPVRDAPSGMTLDIQHLPIKGSASASVVLIEFSDYECPFCSRYSTGTGRDIEKEFVQTGKVKLAFVNNPLPIHSNAKALAVAAICAGDQGQYWEMRDQLFTAAPRTKDAILDIAQILNLDIAKFQLCAISSPSPREVVDRDILMAKNLDLTGTPSFAIGHVDFQNFVRIDKFIVGAQPLSIFELAIKEVLSQSGKKSVNNSRL